MRYITSIACLISLIWAPPCVSQIRETGWRAGNPDVPNQDAGWNLGHTRQIKGIEYSPDGKFIATAAADASIRIWDSATGTLRSTITTDIEHPYDLHWSPDSTRLLLGSYHNNSVWEIATGKLTASVQNPNWSVSDIDWLPDGQSFATGTDHQIAVFDLSLKLLRTYEVNRPGVQIVGLIRPATAVYSVIDRNLNATETHAIDLQTGRRVPGW